MSSLNDLQDLIHEKYGIAAADLDPQASMREKGFDSLALVEFVFAIEDKFGITMPDTDLNIDTLAQLAEVVDRLQAEKAEKAAQTQDAAASAPASPSSST
jgi:acyl carrier protein